MILDCLAMLTGIYFVTMAIALATMQKVEVAVILAVVGMTGILGAICISVPHFYGYRVLTNHRAALVVLEPQYPTPNSLSISIIPLLLSK